MFGYSHKILMRFVVLAVLLCFGLPIFSCDSGNGDSTELSGFVRSGIEPISFSTVTLFSTGTGEGPQVLAETQSDLRGFFSFTYRRPSDPNAVLYLISNNMLFNVSQRIELPELNSIHLASVLGATPVPSEVVINERTTVATAYAMAQFITQSGGIDGSAPGLQNAAAIAGNLVDVETGGVGSVLGAFPNGLATSTMPMFNSLANLLSACVRDESECLDLFFLTTTPAGDIPGNTFQAAVNIAHFPWQNVDDIFSLSEIQTTYIPVLTSDADLQAWTLAISYVGNGFELNGPGNIAFDKDGNAWICNNYLFQLDPLDPDGNVCGDDHVLKFTPTGEDFPGAPYQGGGLYGAGFGVTLDPRGDVWVGNFGFQGSNCPYDIEELSQSVSQFAPDGTPISPNSEGNETGKFHGGYQGAGNTILRPQGTVSDKMGNIWIASCGGDNVTQFPLGDPASAFAIAPVDDSSEPLLQKPFDIAIDPMGNAWVTSNGNHSVFAFDPSGTLIHSLTGTEASDAGIVLPMGIATDALGNKWVSNSGVLNAPCDAGISDSSLSDTVDMANEPGFMGEHASITMILPDGTPSAGSPFKGGGLILPWGIAVDGNGNIWVANFDGQRVSNICGAKPETCPPGFETGDPISPDGGYHSDALERNTAVEIDPSGNVWLTNNWRLFPNPQNPGGHEMVVFIGLAKPVQTPLIGPPNM